jgi:hypothetical protein
MDCLNKGPRASCEAKSILSADLRVRSGYGLEYAEHPSLVMFWLRPQVVKPQLSGFGTGPKPGQNPCSTMLKGENIEQLGHPATPVVDG